MSIYLGIDPGLATVGFGAIESDGRNIRYLDHGVIKTPASMELPERLFVIKRDILKIIKALKPSAIGVEELFFARNVTNAIKVAMARGVIVESIYALSVPIFEFTPLQIKNNITGYGAADKLQVQEMVKRLLKLNRHPKPDDAADGLAIAICTERVANVNLNSKVSA